MHRDYPMLLTPDAGYLGLEDGLVLTGIQMTPPAHSLVIARARLSTVRTVQLRARLWLHPHMDLSRRQGELHITYPPGAMYAQNLGV